jgi:transposase-like protein
MSKKAFTPAVQRIVIKRMRRECRALYMVAGGKYSERGRPLLQDGEAKSTTHARIAMMLVDELPKLSKRNPDWLQLMEAGQALSAAGIYLTDEAWRRRAAESGNNSRRRNGDRRTYSPAEKKQILDRFKERHAKGEQIKSITAELRTKWGIDGGTLRRWRQEPSKN